MCTLIYLSFSQTTIVTLGSPLLGVHLDAKAMEVFDTNFYRSASPAEIVSMLKVLQMPPPPPPAAPSISAVLSVLADHVHPSFLANRQTAISTNVFCFSHSSQAEVEGRQG